jgi:hypothetical protein
LIAFEDRPDKPAWRAEYQREQAQRIMDRIVEGNVDRYSLREADEPYQWTEDTFWGLRCHDRPPLPPTLASTL